MTATGQGDAAQQGQQAQGEGQGGEGQAPDFGALSSQLEQLAGGQEELRQFLSSHPALQVQQEEQQEQAPEVDLSFLDPADPAFDPDALSQQLTGAFGQYVQQAIEQANAPVVQQMQEMRQEGELRDLIDEFPDLGSPEVSEQVVRAAHEYASALGLPQVANQAGFLRLVYLSGRAIDAAQNEGSGDPGVAHLEGGGGANPGSAQVDPVDAILKPGGKRGASVLDF